MSEDKKTFNPEPEIVDSEEKRDRGILRGVQSVLGMAILTATILTLWNPRSFFKTPNIEDLFQSNPIEEEIAEITEEGPSQIAILAGHWQDKPGNVCRDGSTEHDVNYGIAYRLQILLESQGYIVDLFPEFDEDLFGYEGDVLVAIYSGSCEENPLPPGEFHIGSSLTAENLDAVNDLSICLAESYQEQTNLPFSYDVIDPDHGSYHIFRDISSQTPAVRFEIGALSTNHDLIFNQSGLIVDGIADGIECFLDSKTAAVNNG